jgi:hypothetical protein
VKGCATTLKEAACTIKAMTRKANQIKYHEVII